MGGEGGEEGTCPNKEIEPNFAEGSSNQGDDEVSDKSLKKARYVWQIKGNYHLKCSGDDKDRVMGSEGIETELKPESQVPPTNCYASDSSGESDESQECAVFPSHSEPQSINSMSRKRASPVWHRSCPDWPVLKWQTRQVAKAFVDNTINCVLEDMGFVPLPADSVDILDEEFSAPSREQNENSLEDKAVLMAIQSHGLQRSAQDQDSSFQHSSTNFHKDDRRLYCPSSFSDLHHHNSDFHESHSLDQITSGHSVIPENLIALCSDHPFGGEGSKSEKQCLIGPYQSRKRSFDEQLPNKPCLQKQEIHGAQLFTNFVCTCPVRHSGSSGQSGLESQKNSHEHFSAYHEATDEQCNAVKSKSMDDSENSSSCNVIQPSPESSYDSPLFLMKRLAEETVLSSDSKRRCIEPLTSYEESSVQVPLSQAGSADTSDGKFQSFEHFDFMDAAVVAAIQKKGLSALACTEYG